MKTSKPFSTISYNSDEFLTVKLNDLVARHKIEFWVFVNHHPEEDEKKAHKHLYIVPNGQVNTDELLDYLKEIDPKKPDTPLGCIRCKSSHFMDWYLYALHDVEYLASKGQARKYHYTPENAITSDKDYLLEEVHTMDLSKLRRTALLKEAAQGKRDFGELLANGQIPIQQVNAYLQAYGILTQYTERNGRQTHTPKDEQLFDDDGVLIEPLPLKPKKAKLTPLNDDEPLPFD